MINSASLQLKPEQHRYLSALLSRKQAELAGRLDIALGTTMSFLLEPCTQTMPVDGGNGPRPVGCSAGKDTLYIGADGTVYPCPFFKSFPLGNVLQTQLREIWNNAPFLKRLRGLTEADLSEDCRVCVHLGQQCAGGCRASAYLTHGRLNAMDPACFKASIASPD
jgi:radical SAM protein with 4Fe4S-binding SPASM domain